MTLVNHNLAKEKKVNKDLKSLKKQKVKTSFDTKAKDANITVEVVDKLLIKLMLTCVDMEQEFDNIVEMAYDEFLKTNSNHALETVIKKVSIAAHKNKEIVLCSKDGQDPLYSHLNPIKKAMENDSLDDFNEEIDHAIKELESILAKVKKTHVSDNSKTNKSDEVLKMSDNDKKIKIAAAMADIKIDPADVLLIKTLLTCGNMEQEFDNIAEMAYDEFLKTNSSHALDLVFKKALIAAEKNKDIILYSKDSQDPLYSQLKSIKKAMGNDSLDGFNKEMDLALKELESSLAKVKKTCKSDTNPMMNQMAGGKMDPMISAMMMNQMTDGKMDPAMMMIRNNKDGDSKMDPMMSAMMKQTNGGEIDLMTLMMMNMMSDGEIDPMMLMMMNQMRGSEIDPMVIMLMNKMSDCNKPEFNDEHGNNTMESMKSMMMKAMAEKKSADNSSSDLDMQNMTRMMLKAPTGENKMSDCNKSQLKGENGKDQMDFMKMMMNSQNGSQPIDPILMQTLMDQNASGSVDPMLVAMLSKNNSQSLDPMLMMMMLNNQNGPNPVNPLLLMLMNRQDGSEPINPILMQALMDQDASGSIDPMLLAMLSKNGSQSPDPMLMMMMMKDQNFRKKNKMEPQKDYMSVLRANLKEISKHTVTDLLNTANEAYEQNLKREADLTVLRAEVTSTISKKLDKLLSNSDGQRIIKNLLKDEAEQDDKSVELRLKLKEKGVDLGFLSQTFRYEQGICYLEKGIKEFEDTLLEHQLKGELGIKNDDDEITAQVKSDLYKVDSLIEILSGAVKDIDDQRAAKKREEEDEKRRKEEAERKEKEEIRAAVVESIVEKLKDSYEFKDILDQVKDKLSDEVND